MSEGELARDGLLCFVGFGVGLNPGQGLDRSDQGEGVFVPRVEPEVGEIPRNPLERLKRADGAGKGFGPRLYNTPHAAHGFPRLQEALGVYTFDIYPQKIYDTRGRRGGSLRQIGSHFLRLTHGLWSPEDMLNRVHAEYGDAQGVLFDQPPNARRRQEVSRGVENPKGVPGRFIIVRDPSMMLTLVGKARRLDRAR